MEVVAAASGTEAASCVTSPEEEAWPDVERAGDWTTGRGPQLPKQVLSYLSALPHTPHPLNVIADGRSSVASVLLALGLIPDAHSTKDDKRFIDAERKRLSKTMRDRWTEQEWVRQVPDDLRNGVRRRNQASGLMRRSFEEYQRLLSDRRRATAWLDHCVFYAASTQYNVGVLLLYSWGEGKWLIEVGSWATI